MKIHSYFLLLIILLYSCSVEESTKPTQSDILSPVITPDISNQQVNAFAEDAQGHIWIGTFRGLNKYNAHEYHQYFCTDDSLSLPDNQVQALLKDKKESYGFPPSTVYVCIPMKILLKGYHFIAAATEMESNCSKINTGIYSCQISTNCSNIIPKKISWRRFWITWTPITTS